MESMNDAMKRIQSQDLLGKLRSKEDFYRSLDEREPNYPEISVTNLYDDAMSDSDEAIQIPSKLQLSNKLPERNFFFGVLATLKPEYLNELFKKLIRNATPSLPKKKISQVLKQVIPAVGTSKDFQLYRKTWHCQILDERAQQIKQIEISQGKHELSKRIFKDFQKPDEKDIDAVAGIKRRNIGPSKPQEEEKKEKPNPFTGKFNM